MSIKREHEIAIDDGPESGQCSEDETERFIEQRKSKKHKKRSKVKSRKRKHSDSTFSSTKTEVEFFNPYSVDTDRFENCDPCFISGNQENSQSLNEMINGDVIDKPFNLNQDNDDHLINDPSFIQAPINDFENRSSIDSLSKNNFDDNHALINNKKALYLFDKTGIESNDADLRYFLIDFGFSNAIASDVYTVLYHTPSPASEPISNHEDEEMEDNEDDMYSDLPIIDTSSNLHDYGNSYSPEPANKMIESYSDNNLPISYAPSFETSYNHSLKSISELIDPQSIPDVGPRDPRLNQSKQKFNSISKFNQVSDNNVDKLKSKPVENNTLQVNKEWEVTVANMVKTHLRLYLVHNDINKDEYKSILKRAVNKIISSGEKKLETDKISKFLHSYVIMMQKCRGSDSI